MDVYLAVFTDHDGDIYIYVIDEIGFEGLKIDNEREVSSSVPGYKDCYDSIKDLITDVLKNGDRVTDEYQGYMY